MEEIYTEMVNELLKTGALGAIIAWMFIRDYLRETRSDKVNKELSDDIKELLIKIEAAFKV